MVWPIYNINSLNHSQRSHNAKYTVYKYNTIQNTFPCNTCNLFVHSILSDAMLFWCSPYQTAINIIMNINKIACFYRNILSTFFLIAKLRLDASSYYSNGQRQNSHTFYQWMRSSNGKRKYIKSFQFEFEFELSSQSISFK